MGVQKCSRTASPTLQSEAMSRSDCAQSSPKIWGILAVRAPNRVAEYGVFPQGGTYCVTAVAARA